MSNELALLAQIRHDTQYLKALMGQIAASPALATTGMPTVDFCCDMFDRTDAGVLNGYWSDTNGYWTLRSGCVICQANPSNTSGNSQLVRAVNTEVTVAQGASLAPLSIISGQFLYTSAPPSTAGALFSTSLVNPIVAPNKYAAKLATSDLQIKITFTVSSAYATQLATISGVANSPLLTSLAQTVGGIFGDSVGRTVGTVLTTGATQPVSVSDVSIPAQYPFWGAFSDFASTLTQFTPYSYTTPGVNFSGATATGFTTQNYSTAPAINIGTNTLVVSAVGNVYTTTLNGAIISTVTSILMPSRQTIGFSGVAANALSTIGANGFSYSGITSVKAWPVGSAEPADQSGHGTYLNGYSDKYHSTVNGVVTYNPLA